MSSLAAEILKQQIPLLDYVEGQDWKPARRIARGRLMGLCPLHADRKPSKALRTTAFNSKHAASRSILVDARAN